MTAGSERQSCSGILERETYADEAAQQRGKMEVNSGGGSLTSVVKQSCVGVLEMEVPLMKPCTLITA